MAWSDRIARLQTFFPFVACERFRGQRSWIEYAELWDDDCTGLLSLLLPPLVPRTLPHPWHYGARRWRNWLIDRCDDNRVCLFMIQRVECQPRQLYNVNTLLEPKGQMNTNHNLSISHLVYLLLRFLRALFSQFLLLLHPETLRCRALLLVFWRLLVIVYFICFLKNSRSKGNSSLRGLLSASIIFIDPEPYFLPWESWTRNHSKKVWLRELDFKINSEGHSFFLLNLTDNRLPE